MKNSLLMFFILFICILISIPSICFADSWRKPDVIIYGDNNYPPYSYEENGQPHGVYFRIIEKAARRMQNYNIRIVLRPWKRILDMAEHGDIFAFFPPYLRPSKRPYISEYSIPLYTEETIVCCKGAKQQRPNWPEDFYGLKFGNQLGFLAGKGTLLELQRKKLITLEEVGGTETNLRKLLDGRIDCFITDRDALSWNLKRINDGKHHSPISIASTIDKETGHVAFPEGYQAPYRRKFIDSFNVIIQQMQESGEVEAIVKEVIR